MDYDPFIQALQNPKLYEHPVKQFEIIETHLSWVLLTGRYAYKIKKPVNLGFVDYSTLEKRLHFCDLELKLNQLLAPNLYLNIIPITGSKQHPQLNGIDTPIEYAIQMRQFEQANLISHLLENHLLPSNFSVELANQLAHFHHNTESAALDSPFGTLPHIWQAFLDNFTDIEKHIHDEKLLEKIQSIKAWGYQTFGFLENQFSQRKQAGFIKDCHGDIHLNNLVLMNNQIIIFDRIEFNEDFRYIDVMNEIAFLMMELEVKGKMEEASRFLDQYLKISGDYAGVALLRFYQIYRAMVRAKIMLLSSNFSTRPEPSPLFTNYIDYAINTLNSRLPRLLITFALPGSGKTFLSQQLVPKLNAISIHSDIERKRLFPHMDSATQYSEKNIEAIYQHLSATAEELLGAGYSVIVDATFLKQEHRAMFAVLADKFRFSFVILELYCSEKTLVKRIQERTIESNDATDANLLVLSQLISKKEQLTSREMGMKCWITIDTEKPLEINEIIRKINEK